MKNVRDLHLGQLIYLKDLSYTTPEFSSNGEMREMVGKWGVVTGIDYNRQGFKMKHSEGSEYIFSIFDGEIHFEPQDKAIIILNKNGIDSYFEENNLSV